MAGVAGGFAATSHFAKRSTTPSAEAATVFPGSAWREATPESQGIDAQQLDRAMDYLRSVTYGEKTTRALVVRNGYLI
ncbi:MAG: hypothetical protein IT335_06270, partial [Thermomicrobiales bacterium]|nr:hypothetical protein [Thermomicrobiales bacterium]